MLTTPSAPAPVETPAVASEAVKAFVVAFRVFATLKNNLNK